ncbi:dihydropteroate synthase [Szabonella alba]|uniref:Dihydropteroate synthase n=1 Tax=Szabonella alba TaxID=2804194 RepID=A0A8K0VC38_9RHOB|nr:dihydropteroate synthase [Szabonella alba]MBL4918261.1 dihydropteroate synthase [Szabonella alba]
MTVFRPLPQTGPARSDTALPLAGGWCWFSHAEVLERGRAPLVIPVAEVPAGALARLTAPRNLSDLPTTRPALMGILNVTPDSFSDGGRFLDAGQAAAQARAMVAAGADILDIGGESTRPGSAEVPEDEEIARTAPVIAALRAEGVETPISIDTRKAGVAGAALAAGANIVNDVAALGHDPALAPLVAERGVPVCLMHAQGDPATMQDDPRYDDVVLDVYDYLEARIAVAEAAGILRARIIVDPGIGFGKTLAHNLALIARLSMFHALGCPILLGASRKRFIGTLSDEPQADRRVAGSLAVALAGAAQGAQILRVHDMKETRQALTLWSACNGGTTQ